MFRPKASGNENVFNIIDEVLAFCQAICQAFQYAGIEKKNVPRFAALAAKLFGRTDVQRTNLTNLLPITKPIFDYSTIIEIFYQLPTLS